MNEIMLRGNKETDYKDLDWKIHSLNIDIGIHIAGIEHYIEVLDRSTENVENDRTIYRKLMKKHCKPVVKDVDQPIRRIHELLFLPFLGYDLKSYDLD